MESGCGCGCLGRERIQIKTKTNPNFVQEQMQESSEINEAMSQSVGNDEFDDEELLSELNELEEEDLEAMMMSVPSVAAPALDMPSVPSDSMPVVAAAEEADEDEIAMRELEASMAM